MIRLLWVLGAALAAGLAAAWTYARREEPVPGRAGPALLRGLALFLVLAGLALPALRGRPAAESGRIVLLDVSRSMELASRIEAARAELERLGPERVLLFGEPPRPAALDSALLTLPSDDRSRLAPALEAARLSGAERVTVVSDGEWEDRAAALEAARRLGLGVRELRVGQPVFRLGLGAPAAPGRARAGDTVRVSVELVAGGAGAAPDSGRGPGAAARPSAAAPPAGAAGRAPPGAPDSVRVELAEAAAPGSAAAPESAPSVGLAAATVPVPAPGRATRVELAFVPEPPRSGDLEWRAYELRLPEGADPLGAADLRRFTLEVSGAPGGAVLVSSDPDWEPRFLLPRLERAVLGGAAGYLHLGQDRWVEMGARPRTVTSAAVRGAADRARLLAVQGRFSALPAWLSERIRAHPRRLLLPRDAGPVPGAPLTLAGPLAGEWYPDEPVPPSPIARYLAGIPLDGLPPLATLYRVPPLASLAGAGGTGRDGRVWTPLTGRRSRRGEARPLVVAGRSGARRWAVAVGEGYWRWASRRGPARRAYEGLVIGLAGWLLEGASLRRVELRDPAPGRPLRWRVGPDVRSLGLAVESAAGEPLWSDSLESPGAGVEGPTLEPGRYRVTAAGEDDGGAFRLERPLELAPDPGESLPRPAGEPLDLEPASGTGRRVAAPRPRPLWPFALAALLLCGEWVWRRAIGLR